MPNLNYLPGTPDELPMAKRLYFYQHPLVCGVLGRLSLLVLTANILPAQSHPGWWKYASPEATALVGIDWHSLRASPFADAVREELGTNGLGLPTLECLDQAAQILISSPALLVVASGSFPSEILGSQATAEGFRATSYKNVNLWIAPQPTALSIALMSPQIVLLGSRKILAEAIDRAADLATQDGETARASKRKYSPLLARAAQFAHNTDLWVVSSRLPDPLASRFVPLEVDAHGFEGWVSVQNGLRLEAALAASSSEEALVLAEHLRAYFAGLTSLAHGVELRVDGDQIGLSLTTSAEQFNASLKNAPAPVARPLEVAATPSAQLQAPPQTPAPSVMEEQKLKQPQVIRIVGLDEGPVVIPFPDPAELKKLRTTLVPPVRV